MLQGLVSFKDVAVAEGAYENIKVTTPEDLLLAEKILEKQGNFKF